MYVLGVRVGVYAQLRRCLSVYMCGVVSMYGGVYVLAGVHVSGCIWVYMSGYKNVSVCMCVGVACVWGICTRVCVHMCACVGGARGRTHVLLRSACAYVGCGESEGRVWGLERARTPLSLAQSQNHYSLTM